MKNKKIMIITVKALLILIVLIAVSFAIKACHDEMVNPPKFASDKWTAVQSDQIKSIVIQPFLNSSVCGVTVQKEIAVENTATIEFLRKELNGIHDCSEYIDDNHWGTIKQLRLLINFFSGEKIVFSILFHAKFNVVTYSEIYDIKQIDARNDFSGKCSAKLYNILSSIIKDAKIHWVNAYMDCWDIGEKLTYKGCKGENPGRL